MWFCEDGFTILARELIIGGDVLPLSIDEKLDNVKVSRVD